MMPRKHRLASYASDMGSDFPNPFTLRLQPADVALVVALLENKTIHISKMGPLDINSIRVQMSRLRRKLPKGITIETIYGGYYYMNEKSKAALEKYRRA
jgi:hypothetical protein